MEEAVTEEYSEGSSKRRIQFRKQLQKNTVEEAVKGKNSGGSIRRRIQWKK